MQPPPQSVADEPRRGIPIFTFWCFPCCLKQEQVDDLCEWVLELRQQVEKKGRQILDDLAQHLDDKVRIPMHNDIVNPFLSHHGTNCAHSIFNTN